MEEACDYMETGTIESDNLKFLVLMTDGLFYKHDKKNGPDWETMAHFINEKGIDSYLQFLIEYEKGIGRGSDEKTCIVIEFL